MRLAPVFALALSLLPLARRASAQSVTPPGYSAEHGLDREAVLLTSWQPTAPQQCAVAKLPAILPSADALVATSDMPFLLKQGGLAGVRGSALLSIRFDSAGALERMAIIERDLSDSAAAALTQVVLAGLQPQRPGTPWGVRLRIDLDSVPRYRVGRSERCPAAPLPLEASGARTERVTGVMVTSGGMAASPPRPQTKRQTIKFAVAVDERGQVIDARPIAGTTIDAAAVEPVRALLRTQRWLPELDDGIAVPTVVEHTHRSVGVLGTSPY